METGVATVYCITFLQRAGLMTFDHRKPDPMDCDRAFPIVTLTLDARWETGEHYDNIGELVILSPSSDPKAHWIMTKRFLS